MTTRRSYRTEYARRLELAERRGLSRSQARGHARPGERSVSEVTREPRWTVTMPVADPARLVTLKVGFGDAQRAGRYDALTRALREGRLPPREFRARAGRMRPIAGAQPLSDPAAVLVLLGQAGREDWIFESGRRTPRRRRR